ncbi:SH2 domain-containing protein 1A-like isoform X1 [Arapaima gigas]
MFHDIYYGKISKEETERLLQHHGRDGSFLARDSESEPGAYCLCVRRALVVHTYRMSRSAAGWAVKTSLGVKPRYFQTLNELIDYYRKDTHDNMAPLLHPLERQTVGLDELCKEPLYLEF